jgi:hypothetical protein
MKGTTLYLRIEITGNIVRQKRRNIEHIFTKAAENAVC